MGGPIGWPGGRSAPRRISRWRIFQSKPYATGPGIRRAMLRIVAALCGTGDGDGPIDDYSGTAPPTMTRGMPLLPSVDLSEGWPHVLCHSSEQGDYSSRKYRPTSVDDPTIFDRHVGPNDICNPYLLHIYKTR